MRHIASEHQSECFYSNLHRIIYSNKISRAQTRMALKWNCSIKKFTKSDSSRLMIHQKDFVSPKINSFCTQIYRSGKICFNKDRISFSCPKRIWIANELFIDVNQNDSSQFHEDSSHRSFYKLSTKGFLWPFNTSYLQDVANRRSERYHYTA